MYIKYIECVYNRAYTNEAKTNTLVIIITLTTTRTETLRIKDLKHYYQVYKQVGYSSID